MKAGELRRLLEGVTDAVWEERDYLGMSRIGECPLQLYRDMRSGRRRPSGAGMRYCYEGYLHERDILYRFETQGVPITDKGAELVAPFDERFRGHVDGVARMDGDEPELIEVKSVSTEMFERIRSHPRPADLDQVQIYLRYGEWERGNLIYKCRSNGKIWVAPILRRDELGEELEAKAQLVLRAVDEGIPPACRCGRCA